MKVLFVTTSFPRYKDDPLAAGTFILDLARSMVKLGHKVTVLAPGVKDIPGKYSIDNVEIFRFGYAPDKFQKLTNTPGGIPVLIKNRSPVLLFIPAMFGKMFYSSTIMGKEYDIIHAHWLFNAFPPILGKPFHKKKVVVSIRGSDITNKRMVELYKKMLKLSDGLISVNREGLKDFENLDIPKTHIPNGVNINKIKIPKGKITIVTSGYFIKRKNLTVLAKALKILDDKGYDFHAYFVGDGEEKEELLKIVEKFKNKITFTGFIPQKEVINYLEKSHIFVIPSLFEGRSNALLEAMANGKAIIASDIPQNTEIIKDNKNGLVFDKNSPEQLSEKIEFFINRKEKIKEFGERAQQTIMDLGLTWENSAKKHIEFYKKILNEKKGG